MKIWKDLKDVEEWRFSAAFELLRGAALQALPLPPTIE
jgi:hypothetical protein